MISRRGAIWTIGIAIAGIGPCVVPQKAQAQVRTGKPSPVRRIGVLSIESTNEDYDDWKEFVAELARRGWVEGRNLEFVHRNCGSDVQRLPALAAELAAMKLDLLFANSGTASAKAAKTATSTIPIVFWASADPVGYRLVASLSHPGGNLTGSSSLGSETAVKQLEILFEAAGNPMAIARVQPRHTRVLPHFAPISAALTDAARALGLRLLFVDADSLDELDSVLARLAKERVGAVVLDNDELWFVQRQRIAELFVRRHLPAISQGASYARDGLLLSYEASAFDIARKSAAYVDKILRGAKPADLPVEQVSKWQLIVNRKTAKAIGLTLPQSLLVRADEAIE